MASVAVPSTPNPRGPSLRMPIALVVAGVALAIPTLVAGIIPIAHAVNGSARFVAPNVVRVHLGQGTYMLYEKTGSSSLFASNDQVTITPAEVTVSGPDGSNVDVFERGSVRETISGGGDRFVGAVRFRVPSAGDYTVRVRNDPPRTVLIARPLTDTIKRAIGWFLLAGVGGLVFAAGVTSLIVALFRRDRIRGNRIRGVPAYATPIPPGWHPDPGGSGRWRYWDGYRWTEHVR